jgi:hypothetical protein
LISMYCSIIGVTRVSAVVPLVILAAGASMAGR